MEDKQFDARAWLKKQFNTSNYFERVSYQVVAKVAYAAGQAASGAQPITVQSCEAANQRSPEPGNSEPAKGGLDLLASGREPMVPASGVERNQRPPCTTPGPWRLATLEEMDEWWGKGDKEGCVIVGPNIKEGIGFAVCSTNDDGLPTVRNIADAKLIIAAVNALLRSQPVSAATSAAKDGGK